MESSVFPLCTHSFLLGKEPSVYRAPYHYIDYQLARGGDWHKLCAWDRTLPALLLGLQGESF